MSNPTKAKKMTAFLAALLLAGGASAGGYLFFSRSSNALPPSAPDPDPYSAQKVAAAIDSIVQPRFLIFEDMIFGMSRIAEPVKVKGHPTRRFSLSQPGEKPAFDLIAQSERDYMILFNRCAPLPVGADPALGSEQAEFRYVVGKALEGEFSPKETAWRALLEEERPRLLRGEPADRTADGWLLSMRPVKNDKQCLSCHTRSHPEEMLGIMIYAVRLTRGTEFGPAVPAISRSYPYTNLWQEPAPKASNLTDDGKR